MELEKTIPLRKPVEFGGVKYEQLQLREPTAGDLERAANAGTSTGILISLISLVAKVPRKVAEGLSQRDFQEELNLRRNEALQQVIEKLNRVIRTIAEAEKYDLIVNEAYYVNPRVDITDRVMSQLDSSK